MYWCLVNRKEAFVYFPDFQCNVFNQPASYR